MAMMGGVCLSGFGAFPPRKSVFDFFYTFKMAPFFNPDSLKCTYSSMGGHIKEIGYGKFELDVLGVNL